MRLLTMVLAALAALAAPAVAQGTYPEKPVRLVVGFNPGGGMDTIARTVADKLAAPLGQQVVVENRSGAGGTIAMAYTANARPDGYTLILSETSALIGPVVYDNVGYDPVASYTPVAHLTSAPLALVASPKLGINDVAGLVKLAKSKPGELFYATSGKGSVQHLAGEMLEKMAGIDMQDAPFSGAAPSLAAVLSGEVPVAIVSLGGAIGQAKGGAVKILGLTSPQRLKSFPDLPTIAETVSGFSASPSQFILAPAETPAAAIEKLSASVAKAMQEKPLLDLLEKQGFIPDYKTGPELRAEIPATTQRWTEAARAQKATAK
jgi:tripartite-type tricarboxylate transporter receptor subunit TctC